MMRRLAIVIALLLALGHSVFSDELRNRLQVAVVPNVSFNNVNGFQYKYAVVTGMGSQQRLCGFKVECKVAVTFVDHPAGWFGSFFKAAPAFGCPIVTWGPFSHADDLPPGGSVSGLQFNSFGVPGIATAYGQGFVPIPKLVDGEYTKALPYKDTLCKTYTIGPVGQPSMTLAETVDYMVVQKHQAAAQGWITKQGIIVSLDQKLDQAKAKILQGNNKAATNILNAFVNELQAQKGKAVNEEAYTLLYVNAQWLISRLGPTK